LKDLLPNTIELGKETVLLKNLKDAVKKILKNEEKIPIPPNFRTPVCCR
jgi:hypothetical protein